VGGLRIGVRRGDGASGSQYGEGTGPPDQDTALISDPGSRGLPGWEASGSMYGADEQPR